MSMSVPPSGSATSKLAFAGAVVGAKYRLEEVIGYGGMGSVWSATHLGLGERIAIKLVSANFARSSEARRRFELEAKAAAKIKSRHVPQVFDNGMLDDGTPYLAMELLQGESLAARIVRQGPVPLPETVGIVDQCCRALTRAHSLGIVHRDLKPDNIYLAHSVDDESYVVKVLDFGIAKFTVTEGEATSSTRTGALLGTPLYMSPEQARGLRGLDARTDIYSLGLVVHTMLTGRTAFNAESIGDLLLQVCVQPLPSLLAGAPWLPPAMEDWFRKACAREPEGRFPTAQALLDGLRIAAGVSASSQGAEPPPGGWGNRVSAPTWDAGFAGSSVVGAGASTAGGRGTGVRSSRGPAVVASLLGAITLTVAGAIGVVIAVRGHRALAPNDAPGATAPSHPATVTARPVGTELPVVTLDPIAADASPAPGPSRAPVPPLTPPVRPTLEKGPVVAPPPVGGKPPPAAATSAKPNGAIDLGY
ncbi:MAG TPA: serine/threonine-protein kinase [Polyangiaceae bacterium]|nr:serine/threonine-protein kinase [Polyangiaceae bacterium]